jgi:hypothetical protein
MNIQRHFISAGVYHCRVDDRIVILDARTQKYLSLPLECTNVFLLATGQEPDCGDTQHSCNAEFNKNLRALVEAGILTTSPPVGRPAAAVRVRCTDSLMGTPYIRDRGSLRTTDLIAFVRALATVVVQWRKRNFSQLLTNTEQRKLAILPKKDCASLEQVRDLFARFRCQRVWIYAAADACLFDSLVLSNYLYQYSVSTTLVLGVRSKPFGAHAWIQRRDVVLNDTLENVSRYTPIVAC